MSDWLISLAISGRLADRVLLSLFSNLLKKGRSSTEIKTVMTITTIPIIWNTLAATFNTPLLISPTIAGFNISENEPQVQERAGCALPAGSLPEK